MPNPELIARYGADALAAGPGLQPQTFEQRLAEYDSLDHHFTRLWLDFAINGKKKRW